MGLGPPDEKPSERSGTRDSGRNRSGGKQGDGHNRSGRKSRAIEGLPARRAALAAFDRVLAERIALDDALESTFAANAGNSLDERDRRFARALTIVAFRHFGAIDQRLKRFLKKPLPKKAAILRNILRLGLAQLDHMDVPDHAAVSLTVELARSDAIARHFLPLVNGVMRAAGRDPKTAPGRAQTVPAWLWRRWRAAYGEQDARRILEGLVTSPDLDISVKSDPEHWAEELGGTVLANGSVRISEKNAVETLPGYEDGAWWVQDAAATLPVKLLGSVAGLDVLDLCAAPGGKSAQLLAGGAHTTIVDISSHRLQRLEQNLQRLHFSADIIAADVLEWSAGRMYDAVLLDAPCSATGTIRRHPDVPHTKTEADIEALSELQTAMLERAKDWVRPGGTLIYCTCSLEKEEGEERIADFLKENPHYCRQAVTPPEIGGLASAINEFGDMRTLPFMSFAGNDSFGIDGFFIARLIRNT